MQKDGDRIPIEGSWRIDTPERLNDRCWQTPASSGRPAVKRCESGDGGRGAKQNSERAEFPCVVREGQLRVGDSIKEEEREAKAEQ